MLDIGNLLSVATAIVSITASFSAVATLLAETVDGWAALLNAGATLPTASVDGEIDRVFNGGVPLSTAAVGGGIQVFFGSGTPLSAAAVGGGVWGVFEVEDTLVTSAVDGCTEKGFSVEQFSAAGTLALF